jgi:ketosteroid isomerase-like protein
MPEERLAAADERLEVARRFFRDLFGGRVEEAVRLLEPSVRYRVPGNSVPAGTFTGSGDVARHLEKFLSLAGRSVDVLQWEDWLVGANYVAGLVVFELQRTGRASEFRVVFLVGTSQEMRIESVEVFFSDPAAIERFFSW